MALSNLVITYTSWWQGLSIVSWGYPATLVVDSIAGLVVLFLLPFMARATGVHGGRARPGPGLNRRFFGGDVDSGVARSSYVYAPQVRGCPTRRRQEIDMRFMVMVRATEESEKSFMPDEKLMAEMGRFNEELVRAGIMLAGEGLQPSSKGARVVFNGTSRTVVDGPFAETKELIAGFWLWQVKSREEAIEWVKRCPNPFTHGESVIEIRQVFEAEDFGAEFTPELASPGRAPPRADRQPQVTRRNPR